tara:strand:+ start:241 stop:1095 length:855 start_codon:yes stop_codon:yes gene_type:complete
MKKLLYIFILPITLLLVSCEGDDIEEIIVPVTQSDNFLIGFASNDTSTFKTIDGGFNWIEVEKTPYYMSFVSADTGYGTNYDNIYKTVDGGWTWNKINDDNLTLPVSCMSFSSNNIGYASGWDADKTYKTIDGGVNWFEVNSRWFHSLSFVSDYVGYGGNLASIYKTVDGGVNWYKISSSYNYCISFPSEGVGYALISQMSEYYTLVKTIDDGATWTNCAFSAYSENLGWGEKMISFPSENIGFLSISDQYPSFEDNTIYNVNSCEETPVFYSHFKHLCFPKNQ